jgi:mRNA interferase MazF
VVRRGEIWWAEPPETGRRPHLVLTRDTAIPVLASVLVVPATRRVRGIPTEVALTTDDGMPEDCALTLDNTTVIDKAFLVERICTLGQAKMVDVCHALDHATGCDS